MEYCQVFSKRIGNHSVSRGRDRGYLLLLHGQFSAAGVTTVMIGVGFFKGLGSKTEDYMDPDPYSRLADQGCFSSDPPHQRRAFS